MLLYSDEPLRHSYEKENTYLLQATQQQARDLVYLKTDKAGRILTKKHSNSKYKSTLI